MRRQRKNSARESLLTPSFILLILITFMLSMFGIGMNTGLPLVVEQSGQQASFAGFLVSIYAAVSALMRFIAGNLADRCSIRSLFFTSGAIMFVSSIAPLFGSSSALHIAARVMQGVGFSICTTTLTVALAYSVPESRLGEGMGYRGLGVALSSAVGPLAASALVLHGGGSIFFLVLSAFIATSLVLGWFCPILAKGKEGALLQKNNGEKVVVRVSLDNQSDGKSALQNTPRTDDWKDEPKRRFRFRLFAWGALAPSFLEFLRRLVVGACVAFMLLYAMDRGFACPSLFFMVASAAIIACRWFCGDLLNNARPRPLMMALFVMGTLSFGFLLVFPSEVSFLIASVAYGIAEGLASPFLSSLSMKRCDKSEWGVASGNFYFAGDAGMALGSFLMGIMVEHWGYEMVVAGSTVCSAVGCIFAFVLLRNSSSQPVGERSR